MIDNTKIVSGLFKYATTYIRDNELNATEDGIIEAVGEAYNKCFFDTESALLENYIEREKAAQLEIQKALAKLYEEWDFAKAERQDTKSTEEIPNFPVPPGDYGFRKPEAGAIKKKKGPGVPVVKNEDLYHKSEDGEFLFTEAEIIEKANNVEDILTAHPLHQYAHLMDESGEGFGWSKCASDFNLNEVPREVIDEVNRRHGDNYFFHFHQKDEALQSSLYYNKSVVSPLFEQFSQLHEEAHRVDSRCSKNGTNSGELSFYKSLENGFTFNTNEGELSPELLSHIRENHGSRWDGHALTVPMVKAYVTSTKEDAVTGGGWDEFPFFRGIGATVGNAVGNISPTLGLIPHPAAKIASKLLPYAAPAAGMIYDAIQEEKAKKKEVPDSKTSPVMTTVPVKKAQELPQASGQEAVPTSSSEDTTGQSNPIMQMVQQALQQSGGDPQKALQLISQQLQSAGVEPNVISKIVQQLQAQLGAEGSSSKVEDPATSEEKPAAPPAANNPAEDFKKSEATPSLSLPGAKKKEGMTQKLDESCECADVAKTVDKSDYKTGTGDRVNYKKNLMGSIQKPMEGFEWSRTSVSTDDANDFDSFVTGFLRSNNEENIYKSYVGFDKMKEKLKKDGEFEESAEKIAASVGRKKYGDKMHESAESHKKMNKSFSMDELLTNLIDAVDKEYYKGHKEVDAAVQTAINDAKVPPKSVIDEVYDDPVLSKRENKLSKRDELNKISPVTKLIN